LQWKKVFVLRSAKVVERLVLVLWLRLLNKKFRRNYEE
jgi:hypothetical protein